MKLILYQIRKQSRDKKSHCNGWITAAFIQGNEQRNSFWLILYHTNSLLTNSRKKQPWSSTRQGYFYWCSYRMGTATQYLFCTLHAKRILGITIWIARNAYKTSCIFIIQSGSTGDLKRSSWSRSPATDQEHTRRIASEGIDKKINTA